MPLPDGVGPIGLAQRSSESYRFFIPPCCWPLASSSAPLRSQSSSHVMGPYQRMSSYAATRRGGGKTTISLLAMVALLAAEVVVRVAGAGRAAWRRHNKNAAMDARVSVLDEIKGDVDLLLTRGQLACTKSPMPRVARQCSGRDGFYQ